MTFFDEKETSNSSLQMYRQTVEAVMCALLPDSPTYTSSETEGTVINQVNQSLHLHWLSKIKKGALDVLVEREEDEAEEE